MIEEARSLAPISGHLERAANATNEASRAGLGRAISTTIPVRWMKRGYAKRVPLTARNHPVELGKHSRRAVRGSPDKGQARHFAGGAPYRLLHRPCLPMRRATTYRSST